MSAYISTLPLHVQQWYRSQHTSACVNIRQHTSAGGNSDVISKIRSSCDFENWASLDAYRKQDVVIRHTLEGGFRIINNQESLLAHF
jgi:hypothetical protein